MSDITMEDRPVAAPRRSRSLLFLALEALLISAGVFLGLLGEQWREDAQRRELAAGALHRFRSEVVTNRAAVAAVQEYHVDMKESIEAYLASDADERANMSVQMRGLRPAFFERSAWDLALATQALVDIDQDLAFDLSRVYTAQQTYAGLTAAMGQAMFVLPTSDSPEPLFRATAMYYGDLVLMEPALLSMYDSIVPQIDRALGDATE